jgi:uncharacterized cupin superfamily protein
MEDKTMKMSEKDVAWSSMVHSDRIDHRRKNFTQGMLSNRMVASLYEIPPGKVSYPYHYHCANEEMFYILNGEGELRLNDRTEQVRAGDFIRFPAGLHGAHQLKNTSKEIPLRYLDVGTTNDPDIVIMPDSNKAGLFAGSAPGQDRKDRYIWKYFKLEQEVGYLHGE